MKNEVGIRLIKRSEDCKLTAYPDPDTGGAPWTIGWGSTRRLDGTPFKPGDKITQDEADRLLDESVAKVFMPAVMRLPFAAEMTQEQVGALLSFTYNVGAGFFGNPGYTTITRYLRDKDWDRVPDGLLLYVNPGSDVEEGLRKRRVAEGALWSSGLLKHRNAKRLIVAKQDTLLKKEPLQSFELGPREKVEVPRGRSYTIVDSSDDGVHTRVILDHGAGTWYIYDPHWEVKVPGTVEQQAPDSKVILLNVPYYTQLDSTTSHGTRMCFSSSCAMTAEFLKPGCLGGNRGADDLYMTRYVFRHGDTTNSTAQVRALRDLGIQATFRTNLTRNDVIAQLRKGIPVPVGYLHKGHVSRPTGGGHWLVIVGVDLEKQQYIVNDSWGDCDLVNGGFNGSQNGYRLRYSFRNFEPRWMVEGNGTGWGLIIVK